MEGVGVPASFTTITEVISVRNANLICQYIFLEVCWFFFFFCLLKSTRKFKKESKQQQQQNTHNSTNQEMIKLNTCVYFFSVIFINKPILVGPILCLQNYTQLLSRC